MIIRRLILLTLAYVCFYALALHYHTWPELAVNYVAACLSTAIIIS